MSKLENVRAVMRKNGVDAYMVLSDDYHNSEYVGDYFKLREYISGFTGSAGTLVITMDKAGLWTDGRYFIQAEKQLNGTGIDLYKSGMKGVPTIDEFLREELKSGQRLCVDGRTLNFREGMRIKKYLEEKNVGMVSDRDLSEEIWRDRPAMSKERAFSLDIKYAGETRESKIDRLRKK